MKNPQITVIDAASWKEVFTLSGLSEVPNRMAWSADSQRIAFDSQAVYQYFLHMQDLTRAACDLTLRNLTWKEWNRFMAEPYRPTCEQKPIPRSAVEGILKQVREQIAGGEVDAAQKRVEQLNPRRLAESGQLETNGVAPEQFIQ